MRDFVPDAALVGKARFQVLFFKIYDAALYAPNGVYDRRTPYALRLTYLINGKKDRIIKQTVKEMKRQRAASDSTIEGWVPLMEQAFIDMPKGTSADFIHTGDGRLVLTVRNEIHAELTDRRFIRALMDIWLGPKVRDADFQLALLGKAE
jgi:uridine kinase